MEYRGRKVRVALNDGGVFEGFIHSLDKQDGKLSLEKVVNCESGRKVLGLQHFFENEIGDIDVLEETTTAKEDDERLVNKRGAQSVLRNKYSPAHLSRLKNLDPSKLTLKNQAEINGTETVDDHLADNEVRSNDTYTILSHVDNVFTEAITFIRKHQVIGVALEGISLGRSGKLCWIQVIDMYNTGWDPTHVFLFDVLTLGVACFDEGLKAILEDGNILKVFHDIRMVSDILYHQFKINIVNVFDTQVADVFVYRLRHHNDWPRFVTALAPCLSQHLDLSPEQVHWAVIREHCSKEDEEVWAERPLKKHVVEAAVKDVIYLLELRQVLMEKMLEEFVAGVNIYLSHVRDASLTDSNKYQTMKHLLPVAFQDVRRFMVSYRGRDPHEPLFKMDKDQNGFHENCAGIFQPDVNFSHDSLWHAGSARPKENSRVDKNVSKEAVVSSRENDSYKALESKLMNYTLSETQGNVKLDQDIKSPNIGAKVTSQEPVDTENTELSGSNLMRALIYNQEGNTHESDSEIDGFVLKPAGTSLVPVRKKKTSPQKPALVSHRPKNDSVRKTNIANLQSDNERPGSRKEIHVKNSDRFLRDYKQFVRKGNASDSGSSDCDIIPGLNIRQPSKSPGNEAEQGKDAVMDSKRTMNRDSVPYNFISRGMLSTQEVELFNKRRQSVGDRLSPPVGKFDFSDRQVDSGGDNSSECSDKTLSPEKDLKHSKLNSRNGISLKSLLARQKEFSSQGSSSINSSPEKSSASTGADNSEPVSQRMQALLDAIQKSHSP